jgi:hypothetical protein
VNCAFKKPIWAKSARRSFSHLVAEETNFAFRTDKLGNSLLFRDAGTDGDEAPSLWLPLLLLLLLRLSLLLLPVRRQRSDVGAQWWVQDYDRGHHISATSTTATSISTFSVQY